MEAPNPVEKTEDLARETSQGRSERTPWLALGGVGMTVGIAAGAVIALALLIYWLV